MSWTRAVAPHLFLVLALAGTLFLAWNLPPFMGADELAHVDRAILIVHGQPMASRQVLGPATTAGGEIEIALTDAANAFMPIRFHPERKAGAAMYAKAEAAMFGGPRRFEAFPGAVGYPPGFYLPAAAGLAAGKALGLGVTQSLYLARAANALVCVLGLYAALLMVERSRLFLATVGLLPMTLALFAQVSVDGPLIVATAIAAALVARAIDRRRALSVGEMAAAATLLALAAATKPPYAVLALVLLVAPCEHRSAGRAAAVAPLLAAILWTAYSAAMVQVPLLPGMDPAGQLRFLLTHPLAVPAVAGETLKANAHAYASSFVGVLGWLDTWLARPFYPAAWTALGLAVVSGLGYGAGPGWRRVAPAGLALAVLAFGLIHAALYLIWSPVGAPIVQGVAGRYFLPLAVFLVVALEGGRPLLPDRGRGAWPGLVISWLLLLFPLASLAFMQRAVILRFFIG